jgi:sigma54-dependent transcription regulator
MHAKARFKELEARLDRIEATFTPNHSVCGPAVIDKQLQGWLDHMEAAIRNGRSEEMSELGDMRSRLNQELAIQGDRLATMNLKLNMTHSRVERLDRIQDEVRQTQDEHTSAITKILGQHTQKLDLHSKLLDKHVEIISKQADLLSRFDAKLTDLAAATKGAPNRELSM